MRLADCDGKRVYLWDSLTLVSGGGDEGDEKAGVVTGRGCVVTGVGCSVITPRELVFREE